MDAASWCVRGEGTASTSLIVASRAAKRGVHIRIAAAEPVAEGRPQKLARGRGRGALDDEVLTVEEVGRVLGIRCHGAESWKRRECRARPLPSIADHVLGTPGARTCRMAAGGLRIPTRELEHAVRGNRLGISPWMPALTVGRAERRALVFGLGWEPCVAPPRIR